MEETRIVIADSDADTRSIYHDLLTLAGYEVVTAIDGRDALVKALSDPPALVITEIRLPIIDGFALCELLRRDGATQHVPILIVTTETRIAMMERAHSLGADAVLNKPVMPDAILAETRHLLEQARRSRPLTQPDSGPASERKRPCQSKAHLRMQTTTPSLQPPPLVCPECGWPLTYEQSYIGGVSRRHAEQWDTYVCPGVCGRFEYRRTRKLRQIGRTA